MSDKPFLNASFADAALVTIVFLIDTAAVLTTGAFVDSLALHPSRFIVHSFSVPHPGDNRSWSEGTRYREVIS